MGLDKVIGILLICGTIGLIMSILVWMQARDEIDGWKENSMRSNLLAMITFWVMCTVVLSAICLGIYGGVHLIVS